METSYKNADAATSIRRAKIRRRKLLTVSAVILVVVILAVVVAGRFRARDNDQSNLATAKVQRASILQTISATGSVTAQTGAQVKIGSQITGRIKRLLADVGSQVQAGQVIAELDLPDVRAQLDQALASLQSARVRLAQEESGIGLQRTNVTSDITKGKAGVDSAKASYDQAVENAKLQVSTAESAVREAEANNRNAQTTLKRNKALLAKGYISQQDVDNAQTQADVTTAQLDSARQTLALTKTKSATDVRTAQSAVQNARAVLSAASAGSANNVIKQQQVAEARAAVQQAAAQVDYWKAQWAKTVIRTPITGTVLALDVQQGETIAAGLSAPTLIRVTDLNRLQVDAFVDETDIGSVRLGQPVSVTVDAYPNRSFRGRVTKIASGATMQENVVTYDTTIAVENPEGLLKPDMTATAKIIVGEHRDVLAVPIEAVKNTSQGQVVYVKNGDRTVPQPVVTGASDDSFTEIRRGLRQGQTIVLAGLSQDSPFGGARMTPFGPMGGRAGGRTSTGGGGGRGGR